MLELVSKSPDPESQNVWSQIPPLTTNHVRWSSQFWCASVYLLYPPPRCVKRTHLDTLIIRTTGSTWGLLGKFLFLFPVSLYCVFLWADVLTFSLVLFLSRCRDSGRSLICSFKRAPLCRRTQKQKVCVCVGGTCASTVVVHTSNIVTCFVTRRACSGNSVVGISLCVSVIECTYPNLDGRAYYTPRL